MVLNIPEGIGLMTCIVRLNVDLTRGNVCKVTKLQEKRIPVKTGILFFHFNQTYQSGQHYLICCDCSVWCDFEAFPGLWCLRWHKLLAEVFSWFLDVRFWSSTQMDAGKVISMTPSRERTGWASSPLQWWRSSADERVGEQAPCTQCMNLRERVFVLYSSTALMLFFFPYFLLCCFIQYIFNIYIVIFTYFCTFLGLIH